MSYVHLGGETVVSAESILAICDLDNASYSHRTREFLMRAQKAGEVISVTEELPKSFVVCEENGERRVYLSFLNAATLLKRTESNMIE